MEQLIILTPEALCCAACGDLGAAGLSRYAATVFTAKGDDPSWTQEQFKQLEHKCSSTR